METELCLLILCLLNLVSGYGQLFEGDTCRNRDGNSGICKHLFDCPAAQYEITVRRPVTCSYFGGVPIVCCPQTQNRPTQNRPTQNRPTQNSPSSEMRVIKVCEKFMELTPVPLIWGGRNVRLKEFPHIAAIGFHHHSTKHWLCGGTLISERFVLTAAHCLEDRKFRVYGKARYVRLGDTDLKDPKDDVGVQEISIKRRIPHPDYKYPMKYNDIGLLELQRDATFNDFVMPACLRSTPDIPEAKADVVGYGLTENRSRSEQKLKKAEIDLLPIENCMNVVARVNSLERNALLKNGLEDDDVICAGVLAGGRDSCEGDSGGPLQVNSKSYGCRHEIIGIVSFGIGNCADPNTPAVYVRVSKYVPWIEDTACS